MSDSPFEMSLSTLTHYWPLGRTTKTLSELDAGVLVLFTSLVSFHASAQVNITLTKLVPSCPTYSFVALSRTQPSHVWCFSLSSLRLFLSLFPTRVDRATLPSRSPLLHTGLVYYFSPSPIAYHRSTLLPIILGQYLPNHPSCGGHISARPGINIGALSVYMIVMVML